MRRHTRHLLVAPVLILVLVGIVVDRGEAQQQPGRREFMRNKLEYSKNVLDGLAREDYNLIARDARALKALSEKSAWKDAMIPNASDYVAYTMEFQRLADQLEQKAKQRNLDGSTLAYVQMTITCVNCHKYARLVTK